MAYKSAEEIITDMIHWATVTPRGRDAERRVPVFIARLEGCEATTPRHVQHLLSWVTPEHLVTIAAGSSDEVDVLYNAFVEPRNQCYSLDNSMVMMAEYLVAMREEGVYNDE